MSLVKPAVDDHSLPGSKDVNGASRERARWWTLVSLPGQFCQPLLIWLEYLSQTAGVTTYDGICYISGISG